jgi:hypothetical protein
VKRLVLPLGMLLVVFPLLGFAAESAEDIKQDAKRHRAMAAAHEAAAKCLESGKPPEQCQKALQASCKGLGIGKYCGMKHEH